MSLINVTQGNDCPEEINVVIEIPAHSDPVKYEVGLGRCGRSPR